MNATRTDRQRNNVIAKRENANAILELAATNVTNAIVVIWAVRRIVIRVESVSIIGI